jgi:hypothetical protein
VKVLGSNLGLNYSLSGWRTGSYLSRPPERRPTKEFEVGINVMHLNYLLAFDGIIASRGGIPLIEQGAIIGAIGVREARIRRTRSSTMRERH